jgi:HEAT repeat protein
LTALRQATRDPDGQVRVAANWTLWRIASEKAAVLALKSAVKDAAPAVRAAAAIALTWPGIGSPDDLADLAPVLKDLIPTLQDPDANTRGSAAAAILLICVNSKGKAKGAAPALAIAIRNDDPIVRFRVIHALAGVGPEAKSALPEVIRAMHDPDVTTRKSAAWAIGKIGPDDQSVVTAASKALVDQAWPVRMEAAYTLARVGPIAKPAVEPLLTVTRDSSLQVRVASGAALWRITGEKDHLSRALEEALADGASRQKDEPSIEGVNLFDFLSSLGAPAVPILLEQMSSPIAKIRSLAASCLGLMEPPVDQAIPALVRSLEDPDPKVRQAAADALDLIDPKRTKRAALKPAGAPDRGR